MNIDAIICGDNATVLTAFPDECIDLTVTSPPYDNLRTYNGFTWNFEALAGQLYRVTKPGGVVVWVVGDATVDGSETLTSFKQALQFKEIGFNAYDTMIYQTDKPPMNDRRYQASFEYMFVFSKGMPATFNGIKVNAINAGKRQNGTYREVDGSLKNRHRVAAAYDMKVKGNIWYYHAGGGNQGHPAPFPDDLARDHILSWSNPGDIVLDPFIGSGTTAKMAKETGRHWIGIDISDEYCRLANRRVSGANVPLPFFAQALP
jgi:DNA modification methylase